VDITELILNDHHEQRRMFALLDELGDDPAKLGPVWNRLAILLEVQAAAEEELFDPRLLRVGEGAGGEVGPSAETKDAIHDHNQIRDAVREARRNPVGGEAWWRSVIDAREAYSDHMGEEEREALADFRRTAALQARHDLAIEFAVFEAAHAAGIDRADADPGNYVDRHQS